MLIMSKVASREHELKRLAAVRARRAPRWGFKVCFFLWPSRLNDKQVSHRIILEIL
jgi:hypothetical protein